MNSVKRDTAYYHLPGLFEFYERIRCFCHCFAGIGNTFMNGARLALSMAPQRNVSGAAEELEEVRGSRRRFWN